MHDNCDNHYQNVQDDERGNFTCELQCVGMTSLNPGDILCLLRSPFWLVAASCNSLFAVRQVAILCFMALAHVGVKPLARLMLRPPEATEQVYESEWWFDENGDGHFCIKDRKIRSHKSPPALTYAVRRYLDARSSDESDHLFVTRSGRPLEASSYSLTLLTLTSQLKLGTPVATMVKAFFAEQAAGVLDEECTAFVTGSSYRGRAPKVAPDLQQDLLMLVDPFRGLLLEAMENDDFAQHLLHTDYPSCLPLTGRPPKAYFISAWKPLLSAKDHPWMTELLVPQQSETRLHKHENRDKRFLEYYPKMVPLLESGELPHYQAAKLLNYSRSAWRIRVLRATYGENWWMETNPVFPGSRNSRNRVA